MRTRRLMLIAAVAAALAAAGAAYAAIPDGSGVFNACYKTNGGQLRLVASASECNPSETGTQWSQAGPPGPQGPAGAQGQQGERGPSDAFTKHVSTQVALPAPQIVVVNSLDLPAGSFLLTGAVSIFDGNPENFGASGACFFSPSEPTPGGTFKVSTNGSDQITFTGVVTLAAPQTVELRCRDDGTDDATVLGSRATALQIGTLTEQ